MRQTEITSYEQAAEDLFNKARAALHEIGCYEINMQIQFPKHTRDQLVELRNAVWEMEAWMGQ